MNKPEQSPTSEKDPAPKHPRQDSTKSEEGEIETDSDAMDSIKEDLSKGGQSEPLKEIQESEDAPPPEA